MEIDDELYEFLIEKTSLPSIDLVVHDGAGKYLIGLRNNAPVKDWWFVPGSHIREKPFTMPESLLASIQKELDKDLESLEGIPQLYLGVYDHFYENDNYFEREGLDTKYIAHAYEITFYRPIESLPTDQHREWKWLRLDELLEMERLHPLAKRYFEESGVPADSGLYRALMGHYIHYDRQMWSRTQIMIAVEGGSLLLAAQFFLAPLGPLILAGATLLILAIWVLVLRDAEIRDVNLDVMDRLAAKLASKPLKPRWVSVRAEKPFGFISGGRALKLVFGLLVALNGILILLATKLPDLARYFVSVK